MLLSVYVDVRGIWALAAGKYNFDYFEMLELAVHA